MGEFEKIKKEMLGGWGEGGVACIFLEDFSDRNDIA